MKCFDLKTFGEWNSRWLERQVEVDFLSTDSQYLPVASGIKQNVAALQVDVKTGQLKGLGKPVGLWQHHMTSSIGLKFLLA